MLAFLRRPAPWALLDAATVAAGYYAAFLFRFLAAPTDNLLDYFAPLNVLIIPFCLFYAGCNHLWNLHKRAWQYASAQEVVSIATAAAFATAVVTAADVALGWEAHRPLPISVIVLGGFFSFSGFVALRYRARLLSGPGWRTALTLTLSHEGRGDRTRALVYGAGETGQLLVRRLLAEPGYLLLGFVDDDPKKRGLRIHGIEVLGSRAELDGIVRLKQIDLIILAMSRVGGQDLRDIVSACQDTPAQIRIVPGIIEAMASPVTGPLLREVGVEDLLGRKPVELDRPACARVLTGKVVLVTGACGSIGSELCRQIAGFEPSHLVLFDNNETGIYDLEVELRARFPQLRVTAIVADVTNAQRTSAVFRQHLPDVVYHAAAYKHVPLMEQQPEEAVRVNVLGTCSVLEAVRRSKSERFILVSTDKAVNPLSVMGASKRVAELLVFAAAASGLREPFESLRTAPQATAGRYSAVRFGNVLGSRGSVVPTFARQIQLGGPVTVTHREATRYFIELSEAVSLMLQASAMAAGGEVFMLEMGEQIRVDELARRMIRLRGLRPEIDIPIVYTGLRPGEKLHEELTLGEDDWEATAHPSINQCPASYVPDAHSLMAAIGALQQLSDQGDPAAIKQELMRLVRKPQISKILQI